MTLQNLVTQKKEFEELVLMKLTWIVMATLVLVVIVTVVTVTLPSVSANRFDAHSRSIDIDIDICVQPTDTRQTIITLHDDAEGNVAGWNPGNNPGGDSFVIKASFELKTGFSIEATFVNPPKNGFQFSSNCNLNGAIDTSTDTFTLNCAIGDDKGVVEEGAILTYIITR